MQFLLLSLPVDKKEENLFCLTTSPIKKWLLLPMVSCSCSPPDPFPNATLLQTEQILCLARQQWLAKWSLYHSRPPHAPYCAPKPASLSFLLQRAWWSSQTLVAHGKDGKYSTADSLLTLLKRNHRQRPLPPLKPLLPIVVAALRSQLGLSPRKWKKREVFFGQPLMSLCPASTIYLMRWPCGFHLPGHGNGCFYSEPKMQKYGRRHRQGLSHQNGNKKGASQSVCPLFRHRAGCACVSLCMWLRCISLTVCMVPSLSDHLLNLLEIWQTSVLLSHIVFNY